MPSITRASLLRVALPHRLSVYLFGVLLVLVSSFSTRNPSFGSNQNYRNARSPKLVSNFYPHTCRSPMVLSMSSQVTTAGDNQEVRDLFSKFCDEDSLIDRKSLESMPPFAEMLVSTVGFEILWFGFCLICSRTNFISFRNFSHIVFLFFF
jgi:hypothetical protein